MQVLRLSEELLSGGVLDDACLTAVACGCTQLQALELVQVRAGACGGPCLRCRIDACAADNSSPPAAPWVPQRSCQART